jgi:integrase
MEKVGKPVSGFHSSRAENRPHRDAVAARSKRRIGDKRPLNQQSGNALNQFLAPTKFGLHATRRACAALSIGEGCQPKGVQEFPGHATIDMTLDQFAYLFENPRSDQVWIAAIEMKLLTS